jgi:DNA replication protein DnaC
MLSTVLTWAKFGTSSSSMYRSSSRAWKTSEVNSSGNRNVIFLGGVGPGKTHPVTALGYAAWFQGRSVLFTGTILIEGKSYKMKAEIEP